MFALFHPELLSDAPSPSLPLPIRVLLRPSLIAHFPHHFSPVTPLFPTLTRHRAHSPCRINTEHPMKDASPERALQRASRRISPQGLPSNFNVLYQFQSPRMSYTTKDFKSRRINTYKKLPCFSHLIENTQLQVLCNQHLRVFASQVLWIQHFHKNRGVGGTMRVNTPPRLADALGVPRPSLTSAGSHPIMAGIFGDSR